MPTSSVPRAVRVSGGRIRVLLDGRRVELTNISTTGALLVICQQLHAGHTVVVSLLRHAEPLLLEALVVRVERSDRTGYWKTAVRFVNPLPGIGRIMSQMTA